MMSVMHKKAIMAKEELYEVAGNTMSSTLWMKQYNIYIIYLLSTDFFFFLNNTFLMTFQKLL